MPDNLCVLIQPDGEVEINAAGVVPILHLWWIGVNLSDSIDLRRLGIIVINESAVRTVLWKAESGLLENHETVLTTVLTVVTAFHPSLNSPS